MPASPDDILQAMREAGDEFAKMADTIEGKMPKIIGEFKRLPRQLNPLMKTLERLAARAASVRLDGLVKDLGAADAGAVKFLKTLDTVEKKVGRVASAGEDAAKAMSFSGPTAATARAVEDLTRKVTQLGSQLENRTKEFKDLEKSAERVSKMDMSTAAARPARLAARPAIETPDNADANRTRNAMAGAADAAADVRAETGGIEEGALAAGRAAAELSDTYHKYEADIAPVLQHFHGMEEALQGLSTLVSTARGDLSEMKSDEMLAWAAAAKGQLDAIVKAAEEFPGLEPISAESIRGLRKMVESLEDGDASAEKMRETMATVGREMEDVKAKGRGLNKALLEGVEKLADETKDWYGVSRKNQAEMLEWRIRHQKAAERMVEQGVRPAVAYAVQLGKAIKNVPIEGLNAEVKELSSTLGGALKTVTGMQNFTFTGIVKGALEIEDHFVKMRQQMIDMTSQSGHLSALWSAGLGAADIKDEMDKLYFSMDNLVDTWGVTREEATGATKALIDAGFSMSSILGPSLKEGEGGLLQFAKAGESAMTGLQELGRLSRITGRSMADISAMAGQWREQMGVSIGEVGETYLELEGHARRSGLSVGKFMDRLMASASGFVIFGGRMEDISKTLSDLMTGMRLPPGLAQKISGDFMEQLKQTSMDEAMMTTGMLGDEGRAMMLKEYGRWIEGERKNLANVKAQIEQLDVMRDAGDIAEDAWAAQRGDLVNQRDRLEREQGQMSALYEKAQKGDATSLSALDQMIARHGDMAAGNMRLIKAAIATGGIMAERTKEAIAAGKGPEEVMRALKDGLDEQVKSGKGMLQVQTVLGQFGFENEKVFGELATAAGDNLAMLKKYAELTGKGGDRIAALAAEGGDLEAAAAAIQESVRTPAELLSRLRKLKAEGYAVPEAVEKKLEEAKKKFIEFEGIDAEKQAAAMKEASMAQAKFLAGVVEKPKPPEEQLVEHAKDQISQLEVIKHAMEYLKGTYGPAVLAGLAVIKGLMMANQAIDLLGGMKNVKGALSKGFNKLKGTRLGGRVGRGLQAAKGSRAGQAVARAGRGVGRGASAVASGGKMATKTLAKVGGGIVAPLVSGVFAEMELRDKEQAASRDAYERALAKGKTKAEAKEIAKRAKARATSGEDIGAATGKVAGAAVGAAALAFLGPVGMAIGGYIGAEGGALLGGYIGKAFQSEVGEFNKAIEEIVDIGSFDDAIALAKQEEEARDALQAEKMALIQKEARGERLTSEERDRLRELQKEIIEKERRAEIARSVAAAKKNEEHQKAYEEKMAPEHKKRLEAIRKERELNRKKKRGEKLTAAEENDLAMAKVMANATDDVLRKLLASQEIRALNKESAGIARVSGAKKEGDEWVGGTKADRDRLKKIDERVAALKKVQFAKKEPEKDILQVAGGGVAFLSPGDVVTQAKSLAQVIGGGAGQLVQGFAGPAAPGDGPFGDSGKWASEQDALQQRIVANMSDEAKARLAGIREKRGVMAPDQPGGKGTVDNSTWNVYINSRAEKEIEEAILKVLIKHQQRLVN